MIHYVEKPDSRWKGTLGKSYTAEEFVEYVERK